MGEVWAGKRAREEIKNRVERIGKESERREEDNWQRSALNSI